jgi:hypothetical protein
VTHARIDQAETEFAIVTSLRVLIVSSTGAVEGPFRISGEIWYSGLYRIEVVQQLAHGHHYMWSLQFLVSSDMMRTINGRLERTSTHAKPVESVLWAEAGEKQASIVRVHTEAIAERLLREIEFAHFVFTEQRHRVAAHVVSV